MSDHSEVVFRCFFHKIISFVDDGLWFQLLALMSSIEKPGSILVDVKISVSFKNSHTFDLFKLIKNSTPSIHFFHPFFFLKLRN